MKVLKTMTLIFFLLTSSMAREDFSRFGVERDEVPTGTDLKQNNAQPHLLLVQVKKKVPSGPDPIHNMRGPSGDPGSPP